MSQVADESQSNLPIQSPAQTNREQRISIWQSVYLIVALVVIPTFVLSILAFFARLHWGCELMTHFRLHYAIVLTIGTLAALALNKKKEAIALLLMAIVNGWIVLTVFLPSKSNLASEDVADDAKIRFYICNVLTHNDQYAKLFKSISENDPDVIGLLETDQIWIDNLYTFHQTYKHKIVETNRGNFGISLFSRLPIKESKVEWFNGAPQIVATFEHPAGEQTLILSHVYPPASGQMSKERNEQLQAISKLAKNMHGKVIVAGDLNVTPYSPFFGDLLSAGELIDSRQGRGVFPTWPTSNPIIVFPLIQIPIDHCLVKEGIHVHSRKTGMHIGSDHLPMIFETSVAKKIE